MRALFFVLIFAALPASSLADGWGGLDGKNKKGEMFYLDPSWDSESTSDRDYNLPQYRDLFYITVVKNKNDRKVFKDEICRFKTDSHGERKEFSCKNTGISPLSGVTYRIEKDKKSCNEWGFVYTCISGCSDKIPLIMHQPPWECE